MKKKEKNEKMTRQKTLSLTTFLGVIALFAKRLNKKRLKFLKIPKKSFRGFHI